MTEEQFKQITRWQKKTFPQATVHTKLEHLKEEIEELFLAIRNQDKKEAEFADCFMLLFGAAASEGLKYENICNAIEDKMKLNKRRKWSKPDSKGIQRHIKLEGQSTYSLNGIITFIQEKTGVDIHQNTRKRSILEPRQLAMFIIRNTCLNENGRQISLDKTGKICGNKDHATALHANRHIQNLLDRKDKLLLDNYFEIIKHYNLI